MSGLTFKQWLTLFGGSIRLAPKVVTALPVLIPLLEEITKLAKEVSRYKATEAPMTREEVVTKIGSGTLSEDEKRFFDRASRSDIG